MGGAPPPPHNFAPQTQKTGKIRPFLRPYFGGFRVEDQRCDQGVRGDTDHYLVKWLWWYPGVTGVLPQPFDSHSEEDQGINSGGGLMPTGLISPDESCASSDGLLGVHVTAIPTGHRRPR